MIECINFKSVNKGMLLGFADIFVEKVGIEINGCSLYQKNGSRWLNLPNKEYVNKEGEKKYMPIIRFRDKEHWKLFETQAKEAIEKWCQVNSKTQTTQTEFNNSECPF